MGTVSVLTADCPAEYLGYGFAPAGYTQFQVNRAEIVLHGAFGQAESPGDDTVRRSGEENVQYLILSSSEPRLRIEVHEISAADAAIGCAGRRSDWSGDAWQQGQGTGTGRFGHCLYETPQQLHNLREHDHYLSARFTSGDAVRRIDAVGTHGDRFFLVSRDKYVQLPVTHTYPLLPDSPAWAGVKFRL